ncbi:MAG: winged helix-turn-helix transcriptional regulator [Promethearchaeota archaeon]
MIPQIKLVSSSPFHSPPDDLPINPDDNDEIYVENEHIAIQVKGGQNVPMYSFWDPMQSETKYDVKFLFLFEIIDENQDGNYNPEDDTQVPDSTLALPAMSWLFSEIEITGDNVTHFNITSQGAAFTIQFRNHFGTNASLKFDIIIENYAFVSESEDVMLVLGFHLDAGETEEDPVQTGERIIFGEDAYFETEPTAIASGETINVGFTHGSEEGNPLAYIAYERFAGTLVHDPTIGIDTIIVPPGINKVFFIIIPIVSVLLLSGLLMTNEKYRDFLLNRVIHMNTAPHRLDIEEVLENQIRSQIINEILEDPGIHFNELMRKIGTSPSNLVWHVDILESYKVIKKERVGHYIIYYPYIENNPFSDMNPNIVKSKTTLEVLKTINDYPGIHMNRISQMMILNRKTIKYHVDKLVEAKLITKKKQGRKYLLFVLKEIMF